MAAIRRLASSARITAVLALAGVTLAGCAPVGASPRALPTGADAPTSSSVRATLDSASEAMTFPADTYFMTRDEVEVVEKANAVILGRCMKKAGFDYPAATYTGNFETIKPMRLYGIWNLQNAQRYGYDFPPQIAAAKAALEATMTSGATPAWRAALTSCRATTTALPVLGSGFGVAVDDKQGQELVGLAQSIVSDAYTAASASTAWATAKAEWWACLKAKGIGPNPNGEDWSPAVPSDQAGAIRVAVVDVQCKADVKLVETLSSLEARYQQQRIDTNQAALQVGLNKLAEVVRSAKQVVAEGV